MKLNRIFMAMLTICISLSAHVAQAQLPVLCYPGGDGNGSTGCSQKTVNVYSYVTNYITINSVNQTDNCAPGGCGSSTYSLYVRPTMVTQNKATPLFETDAVTYTLQKYDFNAPSANMWIDVNTTTSSYTSWTAPISGYATLNLPAYSYTLNEFAQYALVVDIKKAGVVQFSYRYCLGTFTPNHTSTTINNLTKINGTVVTTTPLKICYTGSGTAISLTVPYLTLAPTCSVQVWKTDAAYTANTSLIGALSYGYTNYGSPGVYNLNPPYAYTDGYYKVVITGTDHCGNSLGTTVAKYQIAAQPSGNLNVGYINGSSMWVTQGAFGNAICSPTSSCKSNLTVGQATGTGSVSGLKFKLDKLSSGTCSTATWTTVFDGTPYAPWNSGGTLNSWGTIYAQMLTYTSDIDAANGTSLGYQYFTNYYSAPTTSQYRLTAYVYNDVCTSTPFTQVAYVVKNSSASCKTDGEEVATGLEDVAESSNNITAYPNPATNSFTITFNNTEYNGASIKIYDVAGKLVEQRENLQTADNVFSVNAYNNGIFIYHVKLANGDITSGRFVKE